MNVSVELLDALFFYFLNSDGDGTSLTKFAHRREILPFFFNICAINDERVASETSDHHLDSKSAKCTQLGV